MNQQSWLLQLLVSGLAVFLTAAIVPGIAVSGFFAALIAAVCIGIANAIIWPILIFLTLPINILTLGLFTFVVNGAMLKIAAYFVPGFDVRGWWSAIFGAIVLSLVNMLLHWLF